MSMRFANREDNPYIGEEKIFWLNCSECGDTMAYSLKPYTKEVQEQSTCFSCMYSFCEMSELLSRITGDDAVTWHLPLKYELQWAGNGSAARNYCQKLRSRVIRNIDRFVQRLCN